MALVDTYASVEPTDSRMPTCGPFGLSWWAAVCISELIFVLSRAGAQGAVDIEDAVIWLAGLAPFVIQYLGQRFLSWRSTTYIEVWMLSLSVYLTVQIFGLAHFIEYPLYLRVDIGFGRSLASAGVYAGIGSLLWVVTSAVLKRMGKSFITPAVAAALACGTLSVVLFQSY